MAKLRADVEDARMRGVACAYDIVLPDTGAIAMPIQIGTGDEPLIVAVAGLTFLTIGFNIAIVTFELYLLIWLLFFYF